MKKILILVFILFSSNVLAHMEHYKKYNKIEMEIFRNGELKTTSVGVLTKSELNKLLDDNI